VRSPRLALRAAAVAASLVLWAAPVAVSAEPPPPCRATVALSPSAAVVGQQIVYRVRIVTRGDVTEADWLAPERLPGFRVEWLPGRMIAEPQRTLATSHGVREERRALFAERPGELRVPATSVRCRIAGSSGEREFEVTAPAVSLMVGEPPAVGRPAGFAGLIGPISLQAIATPGEIRLGESVRLAFMLRGSGNLWAVDDPLDAIEGAELFPRRPELRLETGPRLTLVKHFAYDVVPLTSGELVVPAVRVAYFDPDSAGFATATSETLRLRIGARANAAPVPNSGDREAPAAKPVLSSAAQAQAPAPIAASWWMAAAALAAGLGASLPLFRRRRVRAARAAALAADLAELAPDENQATAYAGALRAALGRSIASVRSLSAEEIAALPDLPAAVADAAALLSAIERARFDPHAPVPSRKAVERVLSRL
jgi:hypothetical protein